MFPAGPIAWLVSLVLCALAFLEAAALLYIMPLLFPALIPSLALLIARVVLGIFCYVYLKTASLHFR
jgi:hypothetical protein